MSWAPAIRHNAPAVLAAVGLHVLALWALGRPPVHQAPPSLTMFEVDLTPPPPPPTPTPMPASTPTPMRPAARPAPITHARTAARTAVRVPITTSSEPATLAVPGADPVVAEPAAAPAPVTTTRPDALAQALGPAEAPPSGPPPLRGTTAFDYSPDLARTRISGVVIVALEIDPSGRVASARVVKSINGALDRAALEMARNFRFQPRLDAEGQPQGDRLSWSFKFEPKGLAHDTD
jgi:TonB family protein